MPFQPALRYAACGTASTTAAVIKKYGSMSAGSDQPDVAIRPRIQAYTSRNFYARLLEVMALQDVPPDLDIDATIIRVYDRMMQRFTEETSALSAPDFVEIPYGRLDIDPLGALSQIYDTLELDGFEAARPAFERYLSTVQSFQKNAFRGDAQMVERVSSNWGRWIEKWHYAPPDLVA